MHHWLRASESPEFKIPVLKVGIFKLLSNIDLE